jgi:hypothetical protein
MNKKDDMNRLLSLSGLEEGYSSYKEEDNEVTAAIKEAISEGDLSGEPRRYSSTEWRGHFEIDAITPDGIEPELVKDSFKYKQDNYKEYFENDFDRQNVTDGDNLVVTSVKCELGDNRKFTVRVDYKSEVNPEYTLDGGKDLDESGL